MTHTSDTSLDGTVSKVWCKYSYPCNPWFLLLPAFGFHRHEHGPSLQNSVFGAKRSKPLEHDNTIDLRFYSTPYARWRHRTHQIRFTFSIKGELNICYNMFDEFWWYFQEIIKLRDSPPVLFCSHLGCDAPRMPGHRGPPLRKCCAMLCHYLIMLREFFLGQHMSTWSM